MNINTFLGTNKQQADCWDYELTYLNKNYEIGCLSQALLDIRVDFNLYKVKAISFVFNALLSKVVILADKGSLGKATEVDKLHNVYIDNNKIRYLVVYVLQIGKKLLLATTPLRDTLIILFFKCFLIK